MLIQARNKGKQLFFIIGGVLAAASLAVMASRLDFWPSGSPPAPPPPAKAATGNQPIPAPKPVQAGPENKSKPTGDPGNGAAPAPTSPEQKGAGNLAVLTLLRAELEEAKLRTAIAQERDKMVTKAPAAVLAPPPAVQAAPPPLAPKTPEKPRETAPIVVSVQGVDGSTTATIRAKGKHATVRVGENYGGGIVSSITRDGVAVKSGKTITTYHFE